MFPAHAAGAALLLLRLCVAGFVLKAVAATDYGVPVTAKIIILASRHMSALRRPVYTRSVCHQRCDPACNSRKSRHLVHRECQPQT